MEAFNDEEKVFEAKQNQILQEIGRFSVDFEEITFFLKEFSIKILMYKGLKDNEFANIIIGEPNGEPLRQLLEKIIDSSFKEKSEKIFLENILTQFNWLVQIRNRIIHCYWMIGVSNEKTKEPVAMGFKKKISKKGIEYHNLEVNYKQLLELNSDIKLFDEIILTFLSNWDNQRPIDQNISIRDIQKLKFQKVFNKMKLSNPVSVK